MNEIERLLREDRDALCGDAKVPSAGLIYWRASIRARSEAARTVERPLTIAQGLAAAAVVGVGVALVGLLWQLLPAIQLPAIGLTTTVALAVAALVVFSPLALVAIGSRMRSDRPQD